MAGRILYIKMADGGVGWIPAAPYGAGGCWGASDPGGAALPLG